MNAAYKVGLLIYCRRNNLPHPGTIVLDSPLLTYRGPHSRHGALGPDEQEVKKTSLNENFYRFLLDHADQAQFIILENDEPPFALGPSLNSGAATAPKGDRACSDERNFLRFGRKVRSLENT